MKRFLDDAEIDIPCTCGKKISKSIKWLKTNQQLTCASCGTVIDLDARNFNAGVARAERSLADFGKRTKSIKIKL